MSSCSLIVFQGDEQTEYDFLNSWGGAARIWTSLFDRYVPKRHKDDGWLLSTMTPGDTRLWDLVKHPDIPKEYIRVFAWTFDYAIVSAKTSRSLLRTCGGLSEISPQRVLTT